jgi:transmembrane 9 superfamily member 2/4
MTSDYELAMGKDTECQSLCSQTVDRYALKRARELIDSGYVAEWIVDNLPGATSFVTIDKSRKYYAAGFKLGHRDISPDTGKPRYFINNHVTIVIRWRSAPGKDGERGGKVIVGFEVYPKSISDEYWKYDSCSEDIRDVEEGMELSLPSNTTAEEKPTGSRLLYAPPQVEEDMNDGATLNISYSYSVYYREETNVEWANRWDLYFVNEEGSSKIHWLAIFNSVFIAAFLTAVVGVIVARTIKSDMKSFSKDSGMEEGKLKLKLKRPRNGNKSPKVGEKEPSGLLEQNGDADNDADVSSDEELLEDLTGWKLLHGDVFRSPAYGGLLAPLVGSGMQLVFMASGLLLLSCLGVLNPSWRGGFVSVGFGLFIFAGMFSGYFSGRVYKTFGGDDWRKNTLMVSDKALRPLEDLRGANW